ncbi:ABC transporter substrate-binding protein [Rhodococcus sp. X156]|uniref:ABC transporter substrate-binding protein n=1 Tax=Rhodococcus sp. X156 TaxID=2499145 RepID=UPI000FDAA843|nr:ABC transporter substrate-binding protein [Rhodococcus sp. X156]
MHRSTIKLGAAGFALLIAVAGCSSDRAEDPAGAAPSASASAGAATKFGTMDSPCGNGDAKGSTDQGVTDSAISIGYGDDRGFAGSPGLNKDVGDGVTAMIKWCNDQGGINGRQIKGTNYDAAITKVNTVMQQACKSDFMLVGEGFAGDDGAEQTRIGCTLPAVPAFAVGANFANAPMMYQALPNPVDLNPAAIYNQLAALKPETRGAFSVMNSNNPAAATNVTKSLPLIKDAGFNVIDCGVTVNMQGEANYAPFAQKFKDCGAKMVWVATSPDVPVFNFLTAMKQAGVQTDYMMVANGYTTEFAKWNGANGGIADNLHAPSAFQPLENASAVPAVQDYLDIMKAGSADPSLLSMQATSSFLLWANAAKECGSDLTRQCVINKLATVHEWTAGGLNAPTDPGANIPTKCGVLLKLDGASWKQVVPAKLGEFECKDTYLGKVPEAAWGTKLNAERIATTFLTPDVIKPQG